MMMIRTIQSTKMRAQKSNSRMISFQPRHQQQKRTVQSSHTVREGGRPGMGSLRTAPSFKRR